MLLLYLNSSSNYLEANEMCVIIIPNNLISRATKMFIPIKILKLPPKVMLISCLRKRG